MKNNKPKLLWENSTSNSSFSSQTITLNSDDYDVLEVYFKSSIDGSAVYCCKILKGMTTQLFRANTSGSAEQGTYAYVRGMVYETDTSYTFNDSLISYTGKSQYTDNRTNIPLKIYGIKY